MYFCHTTSGVQLKVSSIHTHLYGKDSLDKISQQKNLKILAFEMWNFLWHLYCLMKFLMTTVFFIFFKFVMKFRNFYEESFFSYLITMYKKSFRVTIARTFQFVTKNLGLAIQQVILCSCCPRARRKSVCRINKWILPLYLLIQAICSLT